MTRCVVRWPVVLIPAGFAQVNLRFTGAAVPNGAEMTFGVDNAVNNSPGVIGSTINTILAAQSLNAVLVATCDLSSILVKLGPNASGPAAVSTGTVSGTQSGGAGAVAVAALLTKNTAIGGRHGKGRMYQPGCSEAIVDPGGVLQAAHVTALNTKWNAILAAMATADMEMVLLHADATTPTPVTSITAQSVVATQRRRQRR